MYTFERIIPDDSTIQQCSNLLNIVFSRSAHFSEAYLKWQYTDNPNGNIVGFNAFFGKELAAHYVTMPFSAEVLGNKTKGLLSLNTATHPEHQGKKLFTKLAEMTYDYAAQNGFSFVIGVANANSTPGFIKKLDFQLIAPLDVRLGIGNIKSHQMTACSFKRIWDEKSLKWRLNNPNTTYQIRKSHVLAPTNKYGIYAFLGMFDDEIIKSSDYKIKKNILNPVRLYMGLNNNLQLKKSQYYVLPSQFRPSPLNLIFRDFSGNNLKLNGKDIQFQAIDFDAY